MSTYDVVAEAEKVARAAQQRLDAAFRCPTCFEGRLTIAHPRQCRECSLMRRIER